MKMHVHAHASHYTMMLSYLLQCYTIYTMA